MRTTRRGLVPRRVTRPNALSSSVCLLRTPSVREIIDEFRPADVRVAHENRPGFPPIVVAAVRSRSVVYTISSWARFRRETEIDTLDGVQTGPSVHSRPALYHRMEFSVTTESDFPKKTSSIEV